MGFTLKKRLHTRHPLQAVLEPAINNYRAAHPVCKQPRTGQREVLHVRTPCYFGASVKVLAGDLGAGGGGVPEV